MDNSSTFLLGQATAQLCGELRPDSTQTFNGTIGHPDTIKAAIVWISFADSSDGICNRHPLYSGELPPWFRDVEVDLERYIWWQSYGKMYMDVKTAQQPGADSLKPWNLGKTACYWKRVFGDPLNPGSCTGAFDSEGCINRHTVDQIASTLDSTYFSDVTRVFFIHTVDSFTNETVGAWSDIQYRCTGCPYGDQTTSRWRGTVQRPVMGIDDGDEGATKWLLSHEIGHTLGILQHTPGSEGVPDSNRVNYGKYCNMRFGTEGPIDYVNNDFAPWHLWNLTSNEPTYDGSARLGWFEDAAFDTVRSNTLEAKIYDVRLPTLHNAVLVDTRVDQYDSQFWLIHHQDNEFDALYGGDRLAIWHMRNPRRWETLPSEPWDFDLEAAVGKLQNPDCSPTNPPGNPPSATYGRDSLECRLSRGNPSNLYTDAGPDTLGPTTNPSTNDYGTDMYPGTQSVYTGISIQDIHFGSPQLPYLQPYLVDIIFPDRDESPYLYVQRGRNFPRYVNLLAGLGQLANGDGTYELGSDVVSVGVSEAVADDRYIFKIREDGQSTTFFDSIELIEIDHDPSIEVMANKQGVVAGYAEAVAANAAIGLSGDVLGRLATRGDPVHGAGGDTLVLQWFSIRVPIGSGGILLSTSGREKGDMLNDGSLVVEARDGGEGWREVARIAPRSRFTDFLLTDDDLRRTGPEAEIRLRWLDFHSLDYAVFVSTASETLWSARWVVPDSAEIAYGGSRLSEIRNVDGALVVLNPGSKLTVAFPARDVTPGRMRALMLASHGYYVIPAQMKAGESGITEKTIAYFERSRPNPFNPSTHVLFGLNRGAVVSLGIYSVRGELVRRIYEGPLESGDHDFLWEGRDARGREVPAGVYFFRLEAGPECVTGKLVAIK